MTLDVTRYALSMNFSWVEQDRIAGCRGPRSDDDLRFLFSVGVRALVRLEYDRVTDMNSERVERAGFEECYEPVQDGTAPTQQQIDRVLRFARTAIESGRPVAVSCLAGCGRTGTILACYLVTKGHDASTAIRSLIALRPCSDEVLRTPAQVAAIEEFAKRFAEGSATV